MASQTALSIWEHLPVVVITAYHSPEVARHASQAGFNAYCPKPLRTSNLLDALAQAVGM